MRIAQIAPLARAVTPRASSSIEQLVWQLTEALVARGHEVTLFASGDSETSARLVATYETGYRADPSLWDNWQFHELVHAAAAFERAADFDVIHSHLYAFPAPLSRLVATTVVHTDHVPTERDLAACYARYPEAAVVALSQYHRRKLAALPDVTVVPNGVAVDRFPFSRVAGDYLLFLGHLIPRKGPLEAIAVARAAGMPLVLAGKGRGEHFRDEVAALIDGEHVRHAGHVDVAGRNRLLAGAAALLFTSRSAEPFGLVMIEAMACGTPVAALRRCAVAEIVDPGVSGWHAADVTALAERIPAVMDLDRERVRATAQRRFDVAVMAAAYERLYRRSLARQRGPGPAVAVAGGG